jgi:hypothetical protein
MIPPPNIPDLTAYLAAPPDLSSPAKPVVGWTDPYYPIHGRSPLRNGYRVPGAWVEECDSEASSPSTVSWRTGSEGTVVESPATSVESEVDGDGGMCGGEMCEDELGEEELGGGEEDEEEEYDPEYATYLLASMLAEEEMKERRENEEKERKENEEIYRIRKKLSRKNDWDGRIECVLGEKMLHFKIIRHLKGCEIKSKIHEEVKMERDIISRDLTGTEGLDGHRQLRSYFDSTVKKRKRDVGEDGGEIEHVERKKRRVGKVPRGILKTYLQRRGGNVVGMVC